MTEELDLTKARAEIVAAVMRTLGPEFERAGEQLAERLVARARVFYDAVYPKGATVSSPEDLQRHLAAVYATGQQAIIEASATTLRLLSDAKNAGR